MLVLKKFLIVIAVVVLFKPFVRGGGLAATPLGGWSYSGLPRDSRGGTRNEAIAMRTVVPKKEARTNDVAYIIDYRLRRRGDETH